MSLNSFFAFLVSADDIWRFGAISEYISNEEGTALKSIFSWSIAHVADYMNRLNGTYSHVFLTGILAITGRWIVIYQLIIFLTFIIFVASVLYLVKKLLNMNIIHFDKHLFLPFSLSLVFLILSSSRGLIAGRMMSHAVNVNYPFVFSCTIVFFGIFIELHNKQISIVKASIYHMFAFLLMIFINGSQQQGGMFLNSALYCSVFYMFFIAQKRKRWLMYTIYMLISAITFSINIYYSLNGSYLDDNVITIPNAVVNSVFAVFDLLHTHHRLTVLLFIIVIPFIGSSYHKSKLEFKRPVIVTMIAFGILVSTLLPWAYGGFSLSEGRGICFYTMVSFIIIPLWLYYIFGFLINKNIISAITNEFKRQFAVVGIATIFVTGTILPVLGRDSPLGNLSRDYASGNATRLLWVMHNLYDRMLDERVTNIEVVTGLPRLILPISLINGEHINSWERSFNLQLNHVDNLQDKAFRVISMPVKVDNRGGGAVIVENALITSYNFIGSWVLDIKGDLPLSMDGNVIDAPKVQLYLLSNEGYNYVIPVYPLILLEPSKEAREIRHNSFFTSIFFKDLPDGRYDVSLVAKGNEVFYNFSQGVFYLKDDVGRFYIN